MKIKYIKQLEKDDFTDEKFDLLVAASGYEIRAIHISDQFRNNSKEKIAFSFSNHKKEKTRIENDKFFVNNGFKIFEVNGNEHNVIIEVIESYIVESKSKVFSLLIDYSSMTRIWYGAVVRRFKQMELADKTINVFFMYSPAIFQEPPNKDLKTSNFEPINGYCNLSVPLYPSALITGLGYERNKAFGLKEFFDAEFVYLFYTEGNKYTEQVLKINEKLIKRTAKNNIIPYNVNDLLLTKTKLFELCKNLQESYRVIIAPLGPKPFTLISFLVASELRSIDVWRISSDEVQNHNICAPAGNIITLKICYE